MVLSPPISGLSTADKPNQYTYTGSKFFTGESLVVKAHSGSVVIDNKTTNINNISQERRNLNV